MNVVPETHAICHDVPSRGDTPRLPEGSATMIVTAERYAKFSSGDIVTVTVELTPLAFARELADCIDGGGILFDDMEDEKSYIIAQDGEHVSTFTKIGESTFTTDYTFTI